MKTGSPISVIRDLRLPTEKAADDGGFREERRRHAGSSPVYRSASRYKVSFAWPKARSRSPR